MRWYGRVRGYGGSDLHGDVRIVTCILHASECGRMFAELDDDETEDLRHIVAGDMRADYGEGKAGCDL